MAFNNDISPQDKLLIDKVLDNEASIKERKLFNELLVSNPAFKNEVEQTRLLHLAIKEEALSKQMNSWNLNIENVQSATANKAKYPFKWIATAISVAAVVVFAVVLYSSGNSSSSQIFEHHFTPDPGLPTTMGMTHDYKFQEAMVAYKRAHYKKAIDQWELLHANNTDNDTLNYFLGVAYLAIEDDKNAVKFLKSASTIENTAFKKELYHYLGMSYLKAGDLELAREYLGKSDLAQSQEVLKAMRSL